MEVGNMDVRSKTVVVTGGTGFLGRHVSDELRHAGADVLALGSGDYDLRSRSQIDRMLIGRGVDAE